MCKAHYMHALAKRSGGMPPRKFTLLRQAGSSFDFMVGGYTPVEKQY